jgi:hypothetical protein
MSQKCLKKGCDREAQEGSNYCALHDLGKGGQSTYMYEEPKKPEPNI